MVGILSLLSTMEPGALIQPVMHGLEVVDDIGLRDGETPKTAAPVKASHRRVMGNYNTLKGPMSPAHERLVFGMSRNRANYFKLQQEMMPAIPERASFCRKARRFPELVCAA